MSALVEGKVVNVGDYVCFKSDYEQSGKIVAIKPGNGYGGKVLVLENPNGFGGEYLRYATQTQELASDCWIEG
jgi:hypothetical protein